jgi:ABC-2 type transport system ATP-binding protein
LILDEPTNGLDPNQMAELRGVVRRVGANRTVILSSHLLAEVQAVCDRVLILHHGRLVADGATVALTAAAHGAAIRVGLAESKVRLGPAVIAEELGSIPGVLSVQSLAPGEGWARYGVQADREVRPEIFAWAVARGQILVELVEEKSSLEELFRRLTDPGEA